MMCGNDAEVAFFCVCQNEIGELIPRSEHAEKFAAVAEGEEELLCDGKDVFSIVAQ